MNEGLVRPFAGLRPTPDKASEVAAPPYDVLNTTEARQLAQGKPWSFLHISKPEIDLPEDISPYDDAVYAKGAESLQRMISDGILVQDSQPCYYIYRLKMGRHVQTGIVGGGSIEAYEQNRIKRHEFTRPDKEDDRVRQIDVLNTQTGPVMAVHRPDQNLASIVENVTREAPAYIVTGEGNVEHTLWVVSQSDQITAIHDSFNAMDAIYIADGHHRSAAASRVAALRKDGGDSFLIVTFPADEVQILDYNRVVKDLNELGKADFLKAVEQTFTLTPQDNPYKPDAACTYGMYLDQQWYGLQIKQPAPENNPVASLDISLLSDRLLSPVLAIGDPRVDKRIDFIGGIRGLGELEKRVDSGEWAVAFSLYPTSLSALMDVADANEVMPPKSTWFEPKLADGLVSLVLNKN